MERESGLSVRRGVGDCGSKRAVQRAGSADAALTATDGAAEPLSEGQ